MSKTESQRDNGRPSVVDTPDDAESIWGIALRPQPMPNQVEVPAEAGVMPNHLLASRNGKGTRKVEDLLGSGRLRR